MPATLAPVCLLVFAWQTEPDAPLVVAANRDERLDRPARALCVLRERGPRILGGRDDLAGGTWLAVNEYGVVAGLTNRPAPGGRDPTMRSRGELPLLLAAHRTADAAVAELLDVVVPGRYNPAWLLVGDRHSLWAVELATDLAPAARALGPGVHVLENAALDAPSPKSERVRSLLAGARAERGLLWPALPGVLVDHVLPEGADGATFEDDDQSPRPAATLAACVHTDGYGTRSAALVRVPEAGDGRPEMLVADGSPCTVPFIDVSDRWTGPASRDRSVPSPPLAGQSGR
jgi:uncharacterized protein with NRDE domain